jgi:membrane protein required for colicin V production
MIETNLNLFDCIVIGIMALSCIFAFFRGLVREILSLIAWIAAGVVTVYYYPTVGAKMQAHFKDPLVAASAGAIALYIGALMGFAIINMIIIKTIKQGGETGMLDNMMGLVFGGLRGAFIISLGFFMMTLAMPDPDNYPKWLKSSVTRPYVEKGAVMLAKAAPDYLRKLSAIEKKAEDHARDYRDSSDDDYREESPAAGYSRDTERQLDRVIESQ